MIDLLKPSVSQVVEGVVGKKILIYGNAGTGKTSNAVKAPKTLVLAFESGLAALDGVPYIRINKWKDFKEAIKQLTDPKLIEELKKRYETIILDGIDNIELLASKYICAAYNAASIGQGNEGYGLWKEYAQEVQTQLSALDGSGFTLIFLDHAGTRDFYDPTGVKFTKIYPAGDKRSIDPIINMCDIVAYAQFDKVGDEKEIGSQLATLYVSGNSAFEAKTRFDAMPSFIKNWNYAKLSDEITKAINAKGIAVVSSEAAEKALIAEQKAELESTIPLTTLIQRISDMLVAMKNKTGKLDEYKNILKDKIGNVNFKCSNATESDREAVETVYGELLALGYKAE